MDTSEQNGNENIESSDLSFNSPNSKQLQNLSLDNVNKLLKTDIQDVAELANIQDFIDKNKTLSDYGRYESVQKSATVVARIAIYILPVAVFFGILILMGHFIYIEDWDSYEKVIYGSVGVVVGYISHFLEKNGITKK